jgi:hypothetical protein
MKFNELIKSVFPKPVIPQKRYLLLATGIIYIALKAYVTMTPDPMDDVVLEQAKDMAVQMLARAQESEAQSDQDINPQGT